MSWERFRCNVDCDADPENCFSEKLIKQHVDILGTDEWKGKCKVIDPHPLRDCSAFQGRPAENEWCAEGDNIVSALYLFKAKLLRKSG